MTLRSDALAIWHAGVEAVDSSRLVTSAVAVDPHYLRVCDEAVRLDSIRRVEIVGAGKAGAGMTTGLLQVLASLPPQISVGGWVNVPEDCVGSAGPVHLHAARPAGINEPTAAGVAGTQEILRRVSGLTSDDLCLVLISGGGSALLPAPVPEVTLDAKLFVTRLLAQRGAEIQELNIVRSQLSEVKNGGLLRRCAAGRMFALIISDVIGDPVDLIASGPTQPSAYGPGEALQILQRYDPDGDAVPASVRRYLQAKSPDDSPISTSCRNSVIGSNATALSAASAEAVRRGYEVVNLGSAGDGGAAAHGQDLLRQLRQQRDNFTPAGSRPVCILSGGETTVTLAETDCDRKGGRNQEVVLGAIVEQPRASAWKNIALVSGGTDGEDGPTDAAGAFADEELVREMLTIGLVPDSFLAINNSYPFFDRLTGLIRTGPTHTNVMDLAVGIATC